MQTAPMLSQNIQIHSYSIYAWYGINKLTIIFIKNGSDRFEKVVERDAKNWDREEESAIVGGRGDDWKQHKRERKKCTIYFGNCFLKQHFIMYEFCFYLRINSQLNVYHLLLNNKLVHLNDNNKNWTSNISIFCPWSSTNKQNETLE